MSDLPATIHNPQDEERLARRAGEPPSRRSPLDHPVSGDEFEVEGPGPHPSSTIVRVLWAGPVAVTGTPSVEYQLGHVMTGEHVDWGDRESVPLSPTWLWEACPGHRFLRMRRWAAQANPQDEERLARRAAPATTSVQVAVIRSDESRGRSDSRIRILWEPETIRCHGEEGVSSHCSMTPHAAQMPEDLRERLCGPGSWCHMASRATSMHVHSIGGHPEEHRFELHGPFPVPADADETWVAVRTGISALGQGEGYIPVCTRCHDEWWVMASRGQAAPCPECNPEGRQPVDDEAAQFMATFSSVRHRPVAVGSKEHATRAALAELVRLVSREFPEYQDVQYHFSAVLAEARPAGHFAHGLPWPRALESIATNEGAGEGYEGPWAALRLLGQTTRRLATAFPGATWWTMTLFRSDRTASRADGYLPVRVGQAASERALEERQGRAMRHGGQPNPQDEERLARRAADGSLDQLVVVQGPTGQFKSWRAAAITKVTDLVQARILPESARTPGSHDVAEIQPNYPADAVGVTLASTGQEPLGPYESVRISSSAMGGGVTGQRKDGVLASLAMVVDGMLMTHDGRPETISFYPARRRPPASPWPSAVLMDPPWPRANPQDEERLARRLPPPPTETGPLVVESAPGMRETAPWLTLADRTTARLQLGPRMAARWPNLVVRPPPGCGIAVETDWGPTGPYREVRVDRSGVSAVDMQHDPAAGPFSVTTLALLRDGVVVVDHRGDPMPLRLTPMRLPTPNPQDEEQPMALQMSTDLLAQSLRTRFAVRLAELRTKAGLTQGELASAAGTVRAYVSHLENARKAPSLSMLFSLAHALHVPVTLLVDFASPVALVTSETQPLPEPQTAQVMLGRRIRDLRRMAGKTQEELALAADGMSRVHVGHLERGMKDLSVVTIARIAMALGVSLAEVLIFRVEEPGAENNPQDEERLARRADARPSALDGALQAITDATDAFTGADWPHDLEEDSDWFFPGAPDPGPCEGGRWDRCRTCRQAHDDAEAAAGLGEIAAGKLRAGQAEEALMHVMAARSRERRWRPRDDAGWEQAVRAVRAYAFPGKLAIPAWAADDPMANPQDEERLARRSGPGQAMPWCPATHLHAVQATVARAQGESPKAFVMRGGKTRPVKNLGWLFRNWQDVTRLVWLSRGAGRMYDGVLVALLDGRNGPGAYATIYASEDLFRRSMRGSRIFRGLTLSFVEPDGRVVREDKIGPGFPE